MFELFAVSAALENPPVDASSTTQIQSFLGPNGWSSQPSEGNGARALYLTEDQSILDHSNRWYLPPSEHHLKLDSFGNLPDGWDGYSGVPATVGAIRDAKALLSIVGQEFGCPDFTPCSSGAIALQWRVGSKLIELELEGAGRAELLVGDIEDYDSEPYVRSLPIDRRIVISHLKGAFAG